MITSYDYGSPLSESGHTGQPGLGGPNGFEARASGLPYIVSPVACLASWLHRTSMSTLRGNPVVAP